MTDADLIAELATVRDLLNPPLAILEDRVVAVGGRLCDAVEIVSTLRGVFDRLHHDLDGVRMGEAIAELTAATASVAAVADRIPEEQAELQDLASTFEGLTPHIRRMTETMRAIELLAVNARIAAAHTGAYEAELTVFTAEIARLAIRIRGTIGQFAQGHRRLVTLLRDAHAGQTRFAKENLDHLRLIVRQTGHSVASVGEHRHRMAETAAEMTEHSRRIGEEVGLAVNSLQIGDMTRQRIEHVGEALGFLIDGLAADPTTSAEAWQAALNAEQRRGVVAAACRLQALHIKHALDEFEHDVRQVIGALEHLAVDAGRLVELGLDVYGNGKTEGFLDGLRGEINETSALMTLCGAGRARVDRVSGEAGAVLRTLLGEAAAVERIETDVRLAGLNTVLKCGRLGSKGETLRVIAEALNDCAGQTVHEVQEVMSALNRAETAAGRLVREETASIEAVAQKTAASLRVLAEGVAGLGAVLAALERDGGKLRELLRSTVSGISVHVDLRRGLQDVVARLDRLAALPHAAEAEVAEASARVLGIIRERYSMAAERVIHDAHAGVESAPSNLAPAAASASIDDLLF